MSILSLAYWFGCPWLLFKSRICSQNIKHIWDCAFRKWNIFEALELTECNSTFSLFKFIGFLKKVISFWTSLMKQSKLHCNERFYGNKCSQRGWDLFNFVHQSFVVFLTFCTYFVRLIPTSLLGANVDHIVSNFKFLCSSLIYSKEIDFCIVLTLYPETLL